MSTSTKSSKRPSSVPSSDQSNRTAVSYGATTARRDPDTSFDHPTYYELPKSTKTLRDHFPTVFEYKEDRERAKKAHKVKAYDKERKQMDDEGLMTRTDLEKTFKFLSGANTVQRFAESVQHDDFLMNCWLSESQSFRDTKKQLLPTGDTKQDAWIQEQTRESDWEPDTDDQASRLFLEALDARRK